jgi:hypothetical protein
VLLRVTVTGYAVQGDPSLKIWVLYLNIGSSVELTARLVFTAPHPAASDSDPEKVQAASYDVELALFTQEAVKSPLVFHCQLPWAGIVSALAQEAKLSNTQAKAIENDFILIPILS